MFVGITSKNIEWFYNFVNIEADQFHFFNTANVILSFKLNDEDADCLLNTIFWLHADSRMGAVDLVCLKMKFDLAT